MSDTAFEHQPPRLLHTALEIPRSLQELGSLLITGPLIRRFRSEEGQPVMVLPGFSAGDGTTSLIRRYIEHWGYDAHPWGQGSNMNPRQIERFTDVTNALQGIIYGLEENLNKIHDQTGQRISLVGWSLGGLISRMLASRHPELIRQVITLGTPFGDPRHTSIYQLFNRIRDHSMTEEDVAEWMAMSDAPMGDIPLSILWSKTDGFVAPHIATKEEHDTLENIHLFSSHMGFAVNPAVLLVVADRLAQPEGGWKPYDHRSAIKRILNR